MFLINEINKYNFSSKEILSVELNYCSLKLESKSKYAYLRSL